MATTYIFSSYNALSLIQWIETLHNVVNLSYIWSMIWSASLESNKLILKHPLHGMFLCHSEWLLKCQCRVNYKKPCGIREWKSILIYELCRSRDKHVLNSTQITINMINMIMKCSCNHPFRIFIGLHRPTCDRRL